MLDKNVLTVVQTNNTVVNEIVHKRNEKIGSTGLNQVANVTTATLSINKEVNKTHPNMTSTSRTRTSNATETVQNLNTNQQDTHNIPQNAYTLIQTSAGSYLIPLSALLKTNTVNSVTAPIVSTGVTTGNTIKVAALNKNTIKENQRSVLRNGNDYLIPDDTHKELKYHCKCCIVLRKICKEKQTCITDYFTSNLSKVKTCECTDRKYPKTSKRLKLFLENYKSNSWCVHKELLSKLQLIKNKVHEKQACASKIESLQDEYNLEDIGK